MSRESEWKVLSINKNVLSVEDRYNSSSVLGNSLESRLRHVEMRPRRVAPAAIVIREVIIWWTEISSSDGNIFTL
jgi:hypothetical protein